jgi:hypothetical protein
MAARVEHSTDEADCLCYEGECPADDDVLVIKDIESNSIPRRPPYLYPLWRSLPSGERLYPQSVIDRKVRTEEASRARSRVSGARVPAAQPLPMIPVRPIVRPPPPPP